MASNALRDRLTLISTLVILTLVAPLMMLGLGKVGSKVASKDREEVPVVIVGLWPIYGVAPLLLTIPQAPR